MIGDGAWGLSKPNASPDLVVLSQTHQLRFVHEVFLGCLRHVEFSLRLLVQSLLHFRSERADLADLAEWPSNTPPWLQRSRIDPIPFARLEEPHKIHEATWAILCTLNPAKFEM